MNSHLPRAGAPALFPALLSPGTATVLAIGLVGLGLFKLLSDDEEAEAQPSSNRSRAQQTQLAAVDKTTVARLAPDLASDPVRKDPRQAVAEELPETPAETSLGRKAACDAEQQETIRRYMSELGKRSAAARARKKAAKLSETNAEVRAGKVG